MSKTNDPRLRKFLKSELPTLVASVTLQAELLKAAKKLITKTYATNSSKKNWTKLEKQGEIQRQVVNLTYNLTNLHIISALLRGKNPYKAFPDLAGHIMAPRMKSIWEKLAEYRWQCKPAHHILENGHHGFQNWSEEAVTYLLNPELSDEDREKAYIPLVFKKRNNVVSPSETSVEGA